jgi:SAM-dependent methyltransferase
VSAEQATRLSYIARPCPLCGSEDDSTVVASSTIDESVLDRFAFASRKLPEYMHHRLVRCPGCTLVYATPVPDAASLAMAYEDAAFDSGVEAQFASRTYAALVRPLLARLPHPIRALDVGTGDGVFLERLLELGVDDVNGVEPSSAPIAAAAPQVRERIVQDVFRPERFEPGSFSLITCFHTIEHVPDPLVFSRDAAELLAEGGVLMLVCHDWRSPVNRALGRRSPIYDIEHVQLFSAPSARNLLERSGLLDIRVRGIRNRYPVSYWTRVAPLPRVVKRGALAMLDGGRMGRISVSLPVGNLVVMGTRGGSS